MSPINSTDQILAVEERPAVVRKGRVTGSFAKFVTVLVGNTEIPAAYIQDYAPLIGDEVAIARQDSTWLVVGQIAGSGENVVINPSFEESPEVSPPSGWGLYNQLLVSTVDTRAPDGGAPDGSFVAYVESAPVIGSYTSVLYSSPIEVSPGQVWAVSAYVAGQQTVEIPTVDATLEVWFHLNNTDVPPSGIVSTVQSKTNVPNPPPFYRLSGTTSVPLTRTHMRVGLRSVLTPTSLTPQGMYWDYVTARLLYDPGT